MPNNARWWDRLQPVAVLLVAAIPALAQLPNEPKHDSGQSVTAAYEGWYHNPDGTFSLLIGYNNRNLKQDLDIPPRPQ
jgi:hypothetical protein